MTNKYSVIYADPPWQFTTYSDAGKGRSSEAYYECLNLEAIKALPVGNLAAENCVLLLWITDPFLFKAKEVIESWGFTYKTVGFYWMKTNSRLQIKDDHEYQDTDFTMGMGYWTRANPEQCLLATRGHPHAQCHDVRRLVVSPRREHSRKPDEMYDYIERLSPGPYIELFARFQREGWDNAYSTIEGIVERRWKSNSYPTIDIQDLDLATI